MPYKENVEPVEKVRPPLVQDILTTFIAEVEFQIPMIPSTPAAALFPLVCQVFGVFVFA
jgi:hypothetical protein